MTLFSITLGNIRSNFKNYWAYFLSSSLSVFVLYLFMSILYSKDIQIQLGELKKFIVLFNVGAVMITLFSAFFIWYSNSFFIKSRKKEYATYMLLGMSKTQVARLNFFENIIVMVSALATGILLGVIFTKFFIMLLFVLMRVSVEVPFQFSFIALKISLMVFLGIFGIIVLHSSVLMRRSNLIDLLNASKKVEKSIKVSFLTYIFGIAAILCIGYGYYIAVKQLSANFLMMPLVVFLVVLGTILFFTSFISLIIHFSKKNERHLFKGTKLISTAQLYYRYKGNVGTLSIIAITTTIALCALVTCIGSYSKVEENSRNMRPYSVEYFNINEADNMFKETLKNHDEVTVKYKDNIEMLKTKIADPLSSVEQDFYIISESEFNEINKHENINRTVHLKTDDCYFIQMQNFVTNKKAIGKKINVNIGKQSYSLNIAATDMKPFLALDHFSQTIVVKDNLYNNMKTNQDKAGIVSMTGYVLNNDFKGSGFIKELKQNLSKDSDVVTFYEHYEDGFKLLGMMAFIGLFMGILFLTATGSIIYFKMNMEAREDKSKFITLSKIGVSKKEIKSAVAKELLLLFGAPLLLAIANTYPATVALGGMIGLNMEKSYIVIALLYAGVYCIYYFVTLNSYMKVISE